MRTFPNFLVNTNTYLSTFTHLVERRDDIVSSAALAAARADDATHALMASSGEDEGMQSALWHSAAVGDVGGLLRALHGGASPDATDGTGFAAIHRASAGGHAVLVARLLEGNARVGVCDGEGNTALHHACTVGCDAVVATLLDAKAIKVEAAGADGGTALMACALHGHAAIADRQ